MENDIISLFLTRKKHNITNYAEIFIKYSLKNKLNLKSIIGQIVEIYFDNYYLEKNHDFSLLMKYFEIGKTNESLMKDVLQSALLFYKNSGLSEQIESDIKTIVILSNIIYLSINLDEFVNEFLNSEIELDERINSYFNIYQSKLKLTNDDLILLKEELLVSIKKDTNAEKKFWKCLISNNYFLSFKKLNHKHLYFVDYKYEIKQLNRYDKDEVVRTSLTKGIYDDILSIYLEELSIFILKNLLKKHDNLYFIEIYPDYFNKNKNLLGIDSIFNNKSIKSKNIFMFNMQDVQSNLNVIKYLYSKGFTLGLKNISSDLILSSNSFDMFDYVFINSELLNNYNEYREVWKIKNVKFIIDYKEEKEVSEEDILKEIGD